MLNSRGRLQSSWNVYFKDEELKETIRVDVMRAYPEMDFFQKDDMMTLMGRVLFVFSKENPNPSYRQGMHELLAAFVWLLKHNRGGKELPDFLRVAYDRTYIEHDAFTMFEVLMQRCLPWFKVVSGASKVRTVVASLQW